MQKTNEQKVDVKSCVVGCQKQRCDLIHVECASHPSSDTPTRKITGSIGPRNFGIPPGVL